MTFSPVLLLHCFFFSCHFIFLLIWFHFQIDNNDIDNSFAGVNGFFLFSLWLIIWMRVWLFVVLSSRCLFCAHFALEWLLCYMSRVHCVNCFCRRRCRCRVVLSIFILSCHHQSKMMPMIFRRGAWSEALELGMSTFCIAFFILRFGLSWDGNFIIPCVCIESESMCVRERKSENGPYETIYYH